MSTIIVDTREQKYGHVEKAFERAGVKWLRTKLPIGDYARLDNMSVVVDRKQHLNEVCGNLCQQHERFQRELLRARDNGIKLIILVESGTVKQLEDVKQWQNPRLKVSPYALSGTGLYRRMATMQARYGVEWRFCRHQDAGRVICELLGVEGEWDQT
ncbi:MAG: ERCC4 domain-containing protein [Eubacteriales bacterium]|nr:ERCC4 domain-containing protein [Eubacteriales bacterium]